MTTRIWTKKQTQETIKALRVAGYDVIKNGGSYKCELDGRLIFHAMVGARSYLITYVDNLFSPQ